MLFKFAFALMSLALPAIAEGAEGIRIGVSCEVSGKVEDGLDDQVCTEIIGVLKQAYPEFAFDFGSAVGETSVTVYIRNATRSGLALQLKWRLASGEVTEGLPLSVVIMDKVLDAGRRHSLYNRALGETPMPKLD